VPRLARPPRFRPAPQPSAGSCARPPPPHLRAATSRVPRLTAQSNAAQHDDGGASIWLWCRAQRALLAPGRRRPAPRPLESAPRAHGPRVPPTRSCRTCAVCPCVCGYNTMSVIHGLRTAYLRPRRTLVARALHTPRCARPSAPRSPPRQRLPAARNPPPARSRLTANRDVCGHLVTPRKTDRVFLCAKRRPLSIYLHFRQNKYQVAPLAQGLAPLLSHAISPGFESHIPPLARLSPVCG
jgi:hypothetical protein